MENKERCKARYPNHYKKLLFKKEIELQNNVWDIFEEIGFTVNRYDEHKEDGSIQEGGEVAILEIKGSEKGIKTADVRQLEDWVKQYTKREGKEPIGMLVGNPFCDKNPENRDDPFSPDVQRYVKDRMEFISEVFWSYGKSVSYGRPSMKLSLISTHQLFKIFCMIKNGKLDADKARKEIMSNRGVFNLKRLSNNLKSKEKKVK